MGVLVEWYAPVRKERCKSYVFKNNVGVTGKSVGNVHQCLAG